MRIADALRGTPHIRFVAPAEPGDETVWFRDADGTGYELSLTSAEPIPDAQPAAYAWDAVAAAIGNHLGLRPRGTRQATGCLRSGPPRRHHRDSPAQDTSTP
ncbi:hypothetical protein [Streptomyces sp. NPDC051776]|uniref:hypothetical protein n=1 Tax=Streptomyces sp. NPDC051776 TaxID=3155414 RepID=UPI00342C8113